MSFDGIVGNAAALGRLRALAESGRPAHAYLFCGPDGVGKRLAAEAFLRALGTDVRVIERPPDRHEILIAQVREVIRGLGLTSDRPRGVIFDEADRMSEEGMNALLKTLEEPPPRTVLILVSSMPERLLPTVRSRCQRILFFPLPGEEMVRYARETLGLGEEDARFLAALADGSVGTARELAGKLEEVRARARELQERALSGELNPIVEGLSKIKDTDEARRAARRDLHLLARALRDALEARLRGRPPLWAAPGWVERVASLDEDEILER
ncbi:MAG: ATP-binding protein, partial [Planctomycetota bacterium]